MTQPNLQAPAPPLPEGPTVHPSSQATPAARLVVVESVYHQQMGGQPTVTESSFGRWLTSDEQPWSRRMQVEEHWLAVDLGWIKNPSQLMIQNELTSWQVQPTDEQRKEAAAKEVLVGTGTEEVVPFASIAPGESIRFRPHCANLLHVLCVEGSTRITVTAMPS